LITMWKQGKIDGSLFSIKKEIQVTIKKKLWCIRNRYFTLLNDLYDDKLSVYNYNVEKPHFENRFK
jgi:hypothetical protein